MKKKVGLIILVALTAHHTPITAHCGFSGIQLAAKLYFKLKSVIFCAQQILNY